MLVCPCCGAQLVEENGCLLLSHPANGCEMQSEFFSKKELQELSEYPPNFFHEEERGRQHYYDSYAMYA